MITRQELFMLLIKYHLITHSSEAVTVPLSPQESQANRKIRLKRRTFERFFQGIGTKTLILACQIKQKGQMSIILNKLRSQLLYLVYRCSSQGSFNVLIREHNSFGASKQTDLFAWAETLFSYFR